jgi:hypothetical protein
MLRGLSMVVRGDAEVPVGSGDSNTLTLGTSCLGASLGSGWVLETGACGDGVQQAVLGVDEPCPLVSC